MGSAVICSPQILEGRARTYADFCRPVSLDGPVLDFVHQRLIARAEAIGWTRSFETDLHLVVDGEVRGPLIEGDAALFLFTADARDVRLKSNTFIPAVAGGADPPVPRAFAGRTPLLEQPRRGAFRLPRRWAAQGRSPPRGGGGRPRLALDEGRPRT
jgi:hypothetical protein